MELMQKLSKLQTLNPYLWLAIIFGLALGIRLWKLGSLPATFFVDEVLSGYLGRYLWEHGMDLYGNRWPLLYFNKFGDYYIILPMYLDGLATFVFGVTRFATRFPTAVLGALAVWPMFGIARRLSGSVVTGLLAALLLAVTPWHVVLSRATTESVIELTVILTMIWLMFNAYERARGAWLFAAVSFAGLSYLIYHTARMLVPLVWWGYVAVLVVNRRSVVKKLLTASLVAALCLTGITLFIGQTDWGSGRLMQTSIFSEYSGVAIRMQEMTYNLGPNRVFWARAFHNKLLGYGREYINQYLEYFSPLFWFTDEAWSGTRYAVSETGPLYLTLILMFGGLVVVVLRNRLRLTGMQKWMVGVLFIAPLPAALTVLESPNVRRSLLIIVPLLLLAAEGWWQSWSMGWKKLRLGLLVSGLLVAEVILFIYHYGFHSDQINSIYRNDGLPELAKYLVVNQDKAEALVVMDAIDFPLYYLFERQDFSKGWSEQFEFGLKIMVMDKVQPREEKCNQEFDDKVLATFPPSTLFFEPATCELDPCHFVEVDRIQGVNMLTYWRVLQVNREPGIECLSAGQ
jgi:4-amino-4-deoxy-L-arabinose transferase-like glycosyltransferase